ncbi:MAG TPA: tRNA (adenosine(37)-N6)-threonylcarbamoyltransferase complex ATPase subunit type 1 TsaE, partial [Polyangiales bacterium]|nr:tRNA (adenosine(37)-N6)-threonylcarbamoyltransferase complex ATPase subunit type 1 TsaE [Polyangiales bacterium]
QRRDMPAESPPSALRLHGKRDTQRLGRALSRALTPGDLVVLEGNLGAGKTYLVQAVARALGVPASQPVTSPTFELVHEFAGRCPIVHADLYRLDPSQSLDELGLDAALARGAVVLVEWGDRFAAQLGAGLWITLALRDGSARDCSLEARGSRGERLLARLVPQLSEFHR